MAEIWYCVHCGYEVHKRGKCHNCKEPLVASPLKELAEGEVPDEVGYSLEEWDDAARGELIAALVDRKLRHRFDGDELVVAADDEVTVDELVDQLSAPDEVDEEVEPAAADTTAVLAALHDAAGRLRIDPTDMIADGDLAEAAGRMFALEDPPGVDPATWAAVGRVTRRLLGALGADEALEDEIAESSVLLCRLLEEFADHDVLSAESMAAAAAATPGPMGGGAERAGPDDSSGRDADGTDLDESGGVGVDLAEPRAGRAAGDGAAGVRIGADLAAAGSKAGQGGSIDGAPGGGAEVGGVAVEHGVSATVSSGTDDVWADPDAAEFSEDDDQEEMVYELEDWMPEERARISLLLEQEHIAHIWEGLDLVVAAVHDERVEALMATIDRAPTDDALAGDGEDDEARYHVLSNLFGAADRLAGDGDNEQRQQDLVAAARRIQGWSTPFAMTDDDWWKIRLRARALGESIANGVSATVIEDSAAALRDLLREFV